MATPENPSARGVTRDHTAGRCSICGAVDPAAVVRYWTPPSERAYFHPTRHARRYCRQCAPARALDGRCHATIDTVAPCESTPLIGRPVCAYHDARIRQAMRAACARQGVTLPSESTGADERQKVK